MLWRQIGEWQRDKNGCEERSEVDCAQHGEQLLSQGVHNGEEGVQGLHWGVKCGCEDTAGHDCKTLSGWALRGV